MLHTHFDVVILGAGVAGLTAAVHLANAGLKPLVLEAAKTPGGRARSQFDPTLNEEVDNGPHLLLGTYQHTLELLSLLGMLVGSQQTYPGTTLSTGYSPPATRREERCL